MAEENSGSHLLLSFILGGAVGAVLGLMYAPNSGDETRRRLRYLAEEVADKTFEGVDVAKERTETAISKGRDIVEKSRERITDAIETKVKPLIEKKESVNLSEE